MTDIFDRAQELALREQESIQTAVLRRATRPLPVPAAGVDVCCLRSGEVIDPRRVQAVPFAVRCVMCERLAEASRRG